MRRSFHDLPMREIRGTPCYADREYGWSDWDPGWVEGRAPLRHRLWKEKRI